MHTQLWSSLRFYKDIQLIKVLLQVLYCENQMNSRNILIYFLYNMDIYLWIFNEYLFEILTFEFTNCATLTVYKVYSSDQISTSCFLSSLFFYTTIASFPWNVLHQTLNGFSNLGWGHANYNTQIIVVILKVTTRFFQRRPWIIGKIMIVLGSHQPNMNYEVYYGSASVELTQ